MSSDPKDEDGLLLGTIEEFDQLGELLEHGELAPDTDSFGELSKETVILTRSQVPGLGIPGPAGALKIDPLPPGVSARLVAITGAERGATFEVTKPLVLLGRVEDVADLVVPDEVASRHHAAIVFQGGKFRLIDLGSTNGTFVDGKLATAVDLSNGSEIRIGAMKWTFYHVQQKR